MEEIFLPTLHYFENNNRFSGSARPPRFMLTPEVKMKTPKEVDLEASTIRGQLWHGLYCIEKSTVEEERSFPMSREALEEIRSWLEAHR